MPSQGALFFEYTGGVQNGRRPLLCVTRVTTCPAASLNMVQTDLQDAKKHYEDMFEAIQNESVYLAALLK